MTGSQWLSDVIMPLALIAFAYSLFLHRDRSTRVCARCGYNLTGAPGPHCSECGRCVTKRWRYRRESGWRHICAISAGAFFAAYVGIVSIRWPSERWQGLIPTTVRICQVKLESASFGWIAAESLTDRLVSDCVSAWQVLLFDQWIVRDAMQVRIARDDKRMVIFTDVGGGLPVELFVETHINGAEDPSARIRKPAWNTMWTPMPDTPLWRLDNSMTDVDLDSNVTIIVRWRVDGREGSRSRVIDRARIDPGQVIEL